MFAKLTCYFDSVVDLRSLSLLFEVEGLPISADLLLCLRFNRRKRAQALVAIANYQAFLLVSFVVLTNSTVAYAELESYTLLIDWLRR